MRKEAEEITAGQIKHDKLIEPPMPTLTQKRVCSKYSTGCGGSSLFRDFWFDTATKKSRYLKNDRKTPEEKKIYDLTDCEYILDHKDNNIGLKWEHNNATSHLIMKFNTREKKNK